MSLLNRLKFLPLKQHYPSRLSPFSSSARLSVAKVKSKQAITARQLFLSRFKDEKKGLQKYAKLSAEEKKAYGVKAAKSNDRAMKEQMKALATNLLKKNTSPYTLFIAENKAKFKSGKQLAEIMKVLAREWLSLPNSQKQRYQREAADNKKQNQVNFSKWAKSLSADERELFRSKGQKYLTKAQRSALSDAPMSAYQAFFKEAFASKRFNNTNPDAHKKEFGKYTKEVAQKWKALSQAQRQSYSAR